MLHVDIVAHLVYWPNVT